MFSSTDLAVEHDYSKNQIVAKKKNFSVDGQNIAICQ